MEVGDAEENEEDGDNCGECISGAGGRGDTSEGCTEGERGEQDGQAGTGGGGRIDTL